MNFAGFQRDDEALCLAGSATGGVFEAVLNLYLEGTPTRASNACAPAIPPGGTSDLQNAPGCLRRESRDGNRPGPV
jgi:hypothetical protein